MRVNVYNEWDPVEEIIVGTAQFARIPRFDLGYDAVQGAAPEIAHSILSGPLPEKIIHETEEDIDNFISELKKLNIKIVRPDPIHFEDKYKTPDWESDFYFCYCPRDILLSFSNMMIESPNGFRSRYFETFCYKKLLIEYMQSGANWICAPKPRLLDDAFNFTDKNKLSLNNVEPIFDAANVVRAGYDLFYLISDTGNAMGCEWLQRVLGDKFKVHPCYNLYSSVHMDTTLALLRPGLALANPERVFEHNLPAPLKKWKILYAPPMVEYKYSDLEPMSSVWLGMNLLMLAPDLAVVDKHQKPMIELLEKNGINTLPLSLRHARTLGGGFHCITLDVRRKGKLENYF